MKGKSKESLRFVIDLKEMKSKTYVATVLGFKVKVLIFVFGGGGWEGWGARKGHCLFCLFYCFVERKCSLVSHNGKSKFTQNFL